MPRGAVVMRRKHHTQMSPIEKSGVYRAIHAIADRLSFTRYSEYRMEKRGVKPDYVRKAILNGDVIEVHNDVKDDIRILLRKHIHEKCESVCAVISLKDEEIVTVYWNRWDDHHKTLDKSKYQWSVNLSTLYELVDGEIESQTNSKEVIACTPSRKNLSRLTSTRGQVRKSRSKA